MSKAAVGWRTADPEEQGIDVTGVPAGEYTLTLTDPKVNNRDLTDEEIERAIDEIQSTIKRYGGK